MVDYLSNTSLLSLLSGIPGCIHGLFCEYAAYGTSFLVYYGFIQRSSIQASYWHDPLNHEVYQKYNLFLADINQEIVKLRIIYFNY